jgi:hypothetical protein
LIIILAANFTNAQASVNVSNKLSFDITSTVSEFVKSTADAVVNVFESKKEDEKGEEVFNPEKEDVKGNTTKEVDSKKDWNICEVYDATYLNTIDLDVASTKAYDKIGKIEERLDEEAELRAEIFEKSKKLTELQKKEKIVFREMRKELEEAKIFYKKMDEVVFDTTSFLESLDCDSANKKDVKVLQESYQETDELLTEEPIFRKAFSSSLKDKTSILQNGVKEAVK